MAARRALEWTRVSKARMVFRYEISDLFQLNFFPYIVHTYKAYAGHADVPSDTGDKILSTLSRHLAIEK